MEFSSIKKICAVGAGAMGAGTALCFAMAGHDVRLYDIADTSLEKGWGTINNALDAFIAHGLLPSDKKPEILARIERTTDLHKAASDAQWVIESALEVLEIKQKIFSDLENICSAQTVFTTNTSGLSPTSISASLRHKDRFVVTHFWNPPHLLPLVEVVPGEKTSPLTVDLAMAMMHRIGKKPIRLNRECLGFVGNRLQLALLREALALVQSGIATAADVDLAVEQSLGRRLAITGPIKSADLGGLDVFKNIFSYLGPDLCRDTGVPPLIDNAVAAGHLGMKTGKGIYPWTQDEQTSTAQLRVEELFRHLQSDAQTAGDGDHVSSFRTAV